VFLGLTKIGLVLILYFMCAWQWTWLMSRKLSQNHCCHCLPFLSLYVAGMVYTIQQQWGYALGSSEFLHCYDCALEFDVLQNDEAPCHYVG
jgi:hypothetical protein